MANKFDESKDGVRPGMNADEAARRLRAHEQNLGHQGDADENSVIGWTEDQTGETLAPTRLPGADGSPAREHADSVPVAAPTEARAPVSPGSPDSVVIEPTPAPALYRNNDAGPVPGSAHHADTDTRGASSQEHHPDALQTGGGVGGRLEPTAPADSSPVSIHAGDRSTPPLQVSGDTHAELIEDSRQSAQGHLLASGGTHNVPYGWQVPAPDGVYGHLDMDANGNWHYQLDNASALTQSLAEGEHVSESFLVHVTAAGVAPQDVRIDVDIRGTNDRPQILQTSVLTGAVQEDLHANAGGWLRAADIDKGDQLHWTLDASQGRYGDLSVDAATGQWHYVLDDSRAATQALSQGQVASESFLATVTDEQGASSSTRVSVTVAGTNDGPVIGQFHAAQATEDGVVALGRIPAGDVDTLDHLSFSTTAQVDGFTLHADGTYSFDPGAASYQHLAQGAVQQMVVPVTVTDSHGATDSRDLTIVLTGSNDLPVFTAVTAQTATEQGPVLHGQLTASDVDAGDRLTFSTPSAVAGLVLNGDGSYSFDPADPAYTSLPAGALQTLTIPVVVTDNHGGVAQQNLVITLTGVNQSAIIGGVASGTVVEDQVASGTHTLLSGGQLSVADPDAGESAFVAHQGSGALQGNYGTLSLDAQGHWQYSADNSQAAVQQLAQGQTFEEHFQVSSLDGSSHTVDITVVGTNDAPVVSASSVSHGALGEDAQPNVVSGQLQATDVDASSQLTWSLLPYASQYGTLTVDPDTGAWNYTLDNSRPATQALAEGEQVIERFVTQVSDEHGASVRQDVVITLTGSNDAPVLQQVPTQYLTENGVAVHGQLVGSDIDKGDALLYGTAAVVPGFDMKADGSWSFDPANIAYQSLPAGATQTLNISVNVDDNHGGTANQILTLVITGTNQGALISGVHSGAVTEDAVTAGSHWLETGGNLSVSDPDQGEAHFTEHLGSNALAGAFGTLTIDAAGSWHYRADNDQPAIQQLAPGATAVDHFTVTSADGTAQQISVTLNGVNDAPVISQVSVTAGGVEEDAQQSTAGQLVASDVDAGAQLTWSLTTGQGVYGSLALDPATGAWAYTLDNSQAATQGLLGGQQVHETFLATVSDGQGGTAQQQLDIVITGRNDLPVISGTSAGAVREDAPVHTTTGTLSALDTDHGDSLNWSVVNADGAYGHFTVDAHTGQWTYALDNTQTATNALPDGAQVQEHFVVQATDSSGQPVSQQVTINITGSNDLPVFATVVARDATEQGAVLHGQLAATDVDAGDILTFSTPAPVAGLVLNGNGSYSFDPADPAYTSLPAGAQQTLTIPVVVTDNHGGVAQQNLVITLTGVNQGATIGGVASGTVVEDQVASGTHTLLSGGQLTVADPDAGESAFVAHQGSGALQGSYGSLSLDAQGHWQYSADNSQAAVQQLAQGQTLEEHFQVSSLDGSSHTVDITLLGTNDAPVVSASSVSHGALGEDAQPNVVSGQLHATDVDASSQLTWSLLPYASQYGTLTIDPDTGAWNYMLDNSRPATQALTEGEQVIERFVTQVIDEHGAAARQDVVITLTGSNDAPVLQQVPTQYLTENGIAVHGQLVGSDVDKGDALVYGTAALVPGFSLKPEGSWSFDPADNAYQSLAAGATQTLNISVNVDDNHGGSANQVLTLIITGTNQGATISGVHTGAVTEDAVTAGSHWLETGGSLAVSDPDQGEAHFTEHLGSNALAGAYGTLTIYAAGSWHYRADNDQPAIQQLAKGATAVDHFTVTSTDGTAQQISVTLHGINDAPVISHVSVTAGGVEEDAPQQSVLGQLVADDVDTGAHLTWSLITGQGAYGSLALDPATGAWAYSLDNNQAATQQLLGGQQVHETFTATVKDGLGGTAQQQLNIVITGRNDLPVISGNSVGAVREDAAVRTATGTLTAVDTDHGDSLNWSVVNADGTYGHFNIDAHSGQWTYSLNNAQAATNALPDGAQVQEHFVVQATDSSGQPVTQRVTIDVSGSNDLPVIGGSRQAALTEDAAVHEVTGTLTHTDPDRGDVFHWSATASNQGQYGDFTFDLNTGTWHYSLDNARPATDALSKGQQVQEVFHLAGTDSSGTPVFQNVVVTITGSNDLPVISGTAQGAVSEDAPVATAGGTLAHRDPDTGDTFHWSLVSGKGAYGTMTFDTASGAWLYTLDNSRSATQALAAGEQHEEHFTVRGQDASGTPVSQVIAVQVNGSNDNPLISGVHQGNVVEDRSMTASGALSFTDVDKGDRLGAWQVRAPQGTYGTLAIDAHGNWTYHLDPALSQSIRAGDTVQDTFTVRVSDNHGGTADQQVTLRITGTNDAPAIDPHSPALAGQVTEDKPDALTAEGTIGSGDPDIGDTEHWQVTGGDHSGTFAGTYGTLSLDQNGHWLYTLDHAKADSLAEGQTVTERFPISVTDGAGERSTAFIQVQVHGANDGPHIGGASTGVVTEDVATTASGRLQSGDVDRLDSAHWQVLGDSHGQFGSLTIDGNGQWTYHLDNNLAKVQALGENDSAVEVFRVQVGDPHGASNIHEVSVRVEGHNDAPFITGVGTGQVTEDTVLKVSGQLLTSDTDQNDLPVFQPADYAGTYGQFVMVEDGHWSYELFPGQQAGVQTLSAGETATETFTVAAVDQHGGITYRPVTVTVFGSNDAPQISGASTGVAIVAINETASGRLVGRDVDHADTTTWHLVDGQGQYGTLSLDGIGRWSYTLDAADPDTRALHAGDQMTDTFRVQLIDDKGGMAEQVVTVTVVGTAMPVTPPGNAGTGAGTGGGGNTAGATAPIVLPAVSVTTTEDVSTVRSGLLQGPLPSGSITWQVTPATGAFGQLSLGANGQWLYTLNNDSPQVQGLNDGQTVQEHFAVRGVDATGKEVSTEFNVTIHGSEDLPHIVGVTTGSATEDQQTDARGTLTVQDPDMGEAGSWTVQQPQGALGSLSVDATGDWHYQLDNAKAQQLNAGDTQIERFQVVAEDRHGGRETHEVVVTVHGTADAPIMAAIVQGTAKPGATQTLNGQVTAQDADAGESLVYSLVSGSHGQYGTLALDQDGNWHYQLDPASANDALRALPEGGQASDSFTLQVRDSTGNVTQQQITLQIGGANDAPTINGASSGSVTDPTTLQTSGQLTVSDPDTGDKATIAALSSAGAHGQFQIDGNGHWSYSLDSHDAAVRALNAGEQLTETFHVTATDHEGAQVGRDVVVTIHGSNDVPVVTGSTTGTAQEDGTVRAQGQLTVTDPDAGDRTDWTVMNTASAYGHFQMGSDGTWVYTLNNTAPQVQALADGQVITETFTAHGSDSHGADLTQVVSIQVQGQNDAAVITGQRTGTVTEDAKAVAGQLVIGGQVHVSDIDNGQGLIAAQTLTGTYGSLKLLSDGNWQYSADNSQSAIQQLGAGQSLVEHLNLSTADGTPYQISVTIQGSNDKPVLSAIAAQTATEDGPLVTGHLHASDVDQGDILTYSTTAKVDGFTLNADGSYSFDPSNAAWQHLAEGAQQKLDIPMKVTDASGASAVQHLVITLTGSNDLPVLSVASPGPVQEGGAVISGHLVGTDVDSGDTLVFSTVAQVPGFSLDADGTWHFDPSDPAYVHLPDGATQNLSIAVAVTDNHGGSATQNLLINLVGSNQGAVVSGTDSGTAHEDQVNASGQLETGGQLSIIDPDSNEAAFVAQSLAGAYGALSIDADGVWHYQADNAQPAIQALGAGEHLAEQFQIHSVDGTAHTIAVNLNGSNDGAVISGTDQANLTVDDTVRGGAWLDARGQLSVSDVDTGQAHFVAQHGISGAYGTLSIEADGAWHYRAENGQPVIQQLGQGEHLTDSFHVTSADGTDHAIVVTVSPEGAAPFPAPPVPEPEEAQHHAGDTAAHDTAAQASDDPTTADSAAQAHSAELSPVDHYLQLAHMHSPDDAGEGQQGGHGHSDAQSAAHMDALDGYLHQAGIDAANFTPPDADHLGNPPPAHEVFADHGAAPHDQPSPMDHGTMADLDVLPGPEHHPHSLD